MSKSSPGHSFRHPLSPKRAALLVALIVSLALGSCSPGNDNSRSKPSGYVAAFDVIHQFNLVLSPDLVTGAFHFSGDAQFDVLANSRIAYLNGRKVNLQSPVVLIKKKLFLPARAVQLLEAEIYHKNLFTYSERPLSFTPPPTVTNPSTKTIKPSLPDMQIKGFVVLDPGHGGKDSGAVGPRTGVTEKRLNLEVAGRVRDILRAKGITVRMTRATDVYLTLSARAKFANSLGAGCFVSIHHNAHSSRSAKGFEVLYSSNNPNGKWRLQRSITLARLIQKNLKGKWATRDRGIHAKSLYVTRHTRMPSVLVEVEFISNSELEPLLKGEWFQKRAAQGIAQGIIAFFRQ